MDFFLGPAGPALLSLQLFYFSAAPEEEKEKIGHKRMGRTGEYGEELTGAHGMAHTLGARTKGNVDDPAGHAPAAGARATAQRAPRTDT